eukprot:6201554-Pleurochrysis_carterae.AAC.2
MNNLTCRMHVLAEKVLYCPSKTRLQFLSHIIGFCRNRLAQHSIENQLSISFEVTKSARKCANVPIATTEHEPVDELMSETRPRESCNQPRKLVSPVCSETSNLSLSRTCRLLWNEFGKELKIRLHSSGIGNFASIGYNTASTLLPLC